MENLAVLSQKEKLVLFERDDLEFDEQKDFIGNGGFDDVYRARLKSGEAVALKIFRESDDVKQEVNIVAVIKPHPCIVKLIGVCDSPRFLGLVMEFNDGDLRGLLASSRPEIEKWENRLDICHQVAMGMDHLHNNSPPIIHGDLKPSNVLIQIKTGETGSLFRCKISGFGLGQIGEPEFIDRSDGSRPYGTIAYIAPERYESSAADSKERLEVAKKSEVYSYGLLLWEIQERRSPFKGMTVGQTSSYVKSGRKLSDPSRFAPKGYKVLAESCRAFDPHQRPSFYDITRRLRETFRPMGLLRLSDPEIESYLVSALDGDTALVRRCRLHLIGKDGAGKTSVRNALLGLEFVENQASTEGIEKVVATEVGVCTAEECEAGEPWKLTEKLHTTQLVVGVISAKTTEASGSDKEKEQPSLSRVEQASNGAMEVVDAGVAPRSVNSKKSRKDKHEEDLSSAEMAAKSPVASNRLKDFIQAKLAEMTGPGKDLVHSIVTMWDKGGQEQYLNMQTPFIAGDAVQLLAFDLTVDPNTPITKTSFRHGGQEGETEQPSFSFKSYGDVILQWLSMMSVSQGECSSVFEEFIKASASSDSVLRMGEAFKPPLRSSPPCILIGTRAQSAAARRNVEAYQEFLKRMYFDPQLVRLTRHLVHNKEGLGNTKNGSLLFFPVECNYVPERLPMSPDSFPEDPVFKELRIQLMNATRRFWEGRKVPRQWFLLLLLIEEVSKESAIVSVGSLFEDTKEACGIRSTKEFEVALLYLDWLGLVIYKPSSNYHFLSQYVITDPEWLFKLFSSFLPMIPDLSSPLREDDLIDFTEELLNVKEKGIMHYRLVVHLTKKVKRTNLCLESLCRLLREFDVLAVCEKNPLNPAQAGSEASRNPGQEPILSEESTFYVPCLVQSDLKPDQFFINCYPGPDTGGDSRICSSPLVLRPKTINYWPESLYFRLIVRLLNKYQPGEPILERNSIVIDNIFTQESKRCNIKGQVAIELVYLHQKYVIATVLHNRDEDLHAVYGLCRSIREELRTEIGKAKVLGFQGFEFLNCVTRNPRMFRDPPTSRKKEEDVLYVDLDNKDRLSFGADGSVYYKFIKRRGNLLLEPSAVKQLNYWYDLSSRTESGSVIGQGLASSNVAYLSPSQRAPAELPLEKIPVRGAKRTSESAGLSPSCLSSAKVTKLQLNKLARKIAAEDTWMPLARELEVPEERIKQIRSDNRGNAREQAFQMLDWWKENGAATDLNKALREENLVEVADKMFGTAD